MEKNSASRSVRLRFAIFNPLPQKLFPEQREKIIKPISPYPADVPRSLRRGGLYLVMWEIATCREDHPAFAMT